MIYGLIGEKLGHSFSREIHGALSSDPYELRELSSDALAPFLRERGFKGVNVTIPYKQAVMPHLDHLAESAVRSGAVNTIVNRGGELYGHNTDFDGFCLLARHAGVDFAGARTVILGRGGAAKAVRAAAISMGAVSVRNAVRNPGSDDELPLSDPGSWGGCDIVVNATPVGMYPDWQGRILDLDALEGLRGVLDCVYNPLRTRLVLDAAAKGIPAEGGLYMLVGQAIRARELFTGEPLPAGVTEGEYQRLLRSKQNIVLCGMPSCGKTTVGKVLAGSCGRRFVDTDEVIVLQAGMEIPEIFAREGEAGFRARETAAIESLAAEQGLVIATGGGAVLKDENIRLLRHNGLLCFLERNPMLLEPGSGRPLSGSRDALMSLYERRLPRYRQVADITISNDGTPGQAVEELEKYVA